MSPLIKTTSFSRFPILAVLITLNQTQRYLEHKIGSRGRDRDDYTPDMTYTWFYILLSRFIPIPTLPLYTYLLQILGANLFDSATHNFLEFIQTFVKNNQNEGVGLAQI